MLQDVLAVYTRLCQLINHLSAGKVYTAEATCNMEPLKGHFCSKVTTDPLSYYFCTPALILFNMCASLMYVILLQHKCMVY